MNMHDPILDHRARIERDRLDAEERRAHALVEQRSVANSPEARVRIWERLHHLRMPRSPGHAILLVIAKQTGLDLAVVHQVQLDRTAPVVT